MKYQIVIAGFGGQGVVFLVKVLSICAGEKGIAFIGTENHGMSQRGGAVSCDIKIGDFKNPVIDKNQADLIIGLDKNESLRNLAYLKQDGVVVVNSDDNYPDVPLKVIKVDVNKKALNGELPIQGLNVYMLGVALKNVENFPFTKDEIKEAIKKINPKLAEQNFEILEKAIRES
ncbi:MAG: ferredoxin oxidoreductase [Epsilonproteobacteria bacterium]|jgi:indolepyruvate ferredoxin oxidoreductase beta subunit|nr:ferredoxin oxidoreductase [Campylobacterota bacterium]